MRTTRYLQQIFIKIYQLMDLYFNKSWEEFIEKFSTMKKYEEYRALLCPTILIFSVDLSLFVGKVHILQTLLYALLILEVPHFSKPQ